MTIKAAAQQTSGVNAAMAYGTDGPVAALGLQTLTDPKGVQPIYAPTPVVREAVLKAHPISPTGSNRSLKNWMQNAATAQCEHCRRGTGCQKVAADFLKQQGLVK